MSFPRLLQRFLRYVQIDTTSQPDAETYPSSPGQREFGRILSEELRAMGLSDARQNEHGIVFATIPDTTKGDSPIFADHASMVPEKSGQSPGVTPVIAWCAHLDTSPETSGENVRPQIVENYPGGELLLPGNTQKVILVKENPELDKLHGRTLITSDGTTLLGADDKAGVAIIMETAAWLIEHPEVPHGPIRICFTCDEEIGHGVKMLTPAEIGATVCYTLDGHASNEIDVETFSADQALVTVRGVNIHPSIAKGRMTNAVRVAAEFLQRLPRDRLSPETTEDREGFVHPYDVGGGVGEVRIKILLRDFDTTQLAVEADLLRQTAAAVMREFPAAQVDVAINEQYRNMADGLTREPHAVALAEEALRRLGRTAKRTIVRGGTDGSRLTELGLPTPNLSCGGHNPHSALEWACLEEMQESVDWLISLARVWGEQRAN